MVHSSANWKTRLESVTLVEAFIESEENMELARAVRANFPALQKYARDLYVRLGGEGDIGNGHLDRFQDVDTRTPVILTTSEMLTTGVDAPTVKNIVLCRVVHSMSNFKQIIGRGTRLRTDYGKWYFTILDFTGTATRNFADPDFDGFPATITEQEFGGDPTKAEEVEPSGEGTGSAGRVGPLPDQDPACPAGAVRAHDSKACRTRGYSGPRGCHRARGRCPHRMFCRGLFGPRGALQRIRQGRLHRYARRDRTPRSDRH